MTAEQQQEPSADDRRRIVALLRVPRRGRIPFAIGVAALALLIAIWTQRHPIAENFIDAELARRGVEARYEIVDIGFSTQRLENLVIGDPARPDLIADWVVVRTSVGFDGPQVEAIEAGAVRLRGRLIDGRLSLGAVDRMLPEPSDAPFSLPELMVSVRDGRMRLDTPMGLVGVKLSGGGVLNDGFRGRLAAVSDAIDMGGCRARGLNAATAIAIDKGAPRLSGPVGVGALACGDGAEGRGLAADLVLALGPALDRWDGRVEVKAGGARANGVALAELAGQIDFAGDAHETQGRAALTSGAMATRWGNAARVEARLRYAMGGAGFRTEGTLSARDATLALSALADLRALAGSADGTPVAPLARRLADALASAGRRMAIDVTGEVESGGLRIAEARIEAASGAGIALSGGDGLAYRWPSGATSLGGTLRTGGGGLPDARVALTRDADGALNGEARVAPYRAGDAALALGPVRFTAAPGGVTRIATRVGLSGPLAGNGRIDGLDMPVAARWDGRGSLIVNDMCAPVRMRDLRVSALRTGPIATRLCPVGGAMLAMRRGRMRGGVQAAGLGFAGTLGGTPIDLRTARAAFGLDDMALAIADAKVRLGAGERVSRLDIAGMDGRVSGGGAAGRFAGADGQIANVPLILSEGEGGWRFDGVRLTLAGEALRVTDAASPARFEPLAADDFALTLAGNAIDATGTLTVPGSGIEVAAVTIAHDLGAGSGRADLNVPGIRFGEAFQPEALTRLTLGVIAEVEGSVSGRGRIRWSPDGVTSDGVFRTDNTSLAAAFGPVEGISGEIRFTDLLGLVTDSGQVGTIAVANPGIAVENGEVRYRLIGEQRVAVEGGRWPFAGGALVLEPTVLDFGQDVERRMTFRVEGVDAAQFLQQFDFGNLNANGTFDGVLPMVFDQRGGRIVDGRLAVREGGGTLAYKGEVSRENLGTWGNIAFGALRSLRYESLDITLNGPLAGEMVSEIRFAGVSQGEGAKRNFLIDRIARLPFVFNVTVRAPFRQLLDSVRSYYDPSRLIERNLPALIEQQTRQADPDERPAVQPSASETMR
ncbi:intermembrane phospholipid transport protein YdbH family protein [Sphingomonas sp.]